ncbi:MAG: hypothetical protein U0929_12460 [Planctomycetaceae bacterium]
MIGTYLRNLYTLLNHSLRQESRSIQAHRFRIGSLLVATWLLLVAQYSTWFVGATGSSFIRWLVLLDLSLILIGGSSYFGSVITEEKEQGTLGLLKLAGFSNASLMFGKSTSRIVTALITFIIQLPFAFLAIVLGGTTTSQILAAYLALGAFLVLLGNIGLMMSVICRRNAVATSLTFLIGFLSLISGHLASFAMTAGYAKKISWLHTGLEWIELKDEWTSAYSRLQEIATFRQSTLVAPQFWTSLAVAAGLFLISWLIFDRFTEYTESQTPHRSQPGQRIRRWQQWVERAGRDPIAWKEFHFGSGGYTSMLGKSLLYLALIGGTLFFEARLQTQYLTSPVEVLHGTLLTVLLIELLAFSAHFLGSEYTGGTLPNLILTPHSLAGIALSKLKGNILSWTPTVLAIFVVSAILWGRDAILMDWQVRHLTYLACFVLLLHLTAYFSIRVQRGAVAWAVVTLILGSIFVLPLLNAVRVSLRGSSPATPWYAPTEGPEFWAPLLYVLIFTCLAIQIAIGAQVRRAVSE